MVDSMVHCVCISCCPNCIFEFLSLCMLVYIYMSVFMSFSVFFFFSPLSFSFSPPLLFFLFLPLFLLFVIMRIIQKCLRDLERERDSSLYSSIIVSITHTSRFIPCLLQWKCKFLSQDACTFLHTFDLRVSSL